MAKKEELSDCNVWFLSSFMCYDNMYRLLRLMAIQMLKYICQIECHINHKLINRRNSEYRICRKIWNQYYGGSVTLNKIHNEEPKSEFFDIIVSNIISSNTNNDIDYFNMLSEIENDFIKGSVYQMFIMFDHLCLKIKN